MQEHLSDKQVDQIMRTIANDSTLTDAEIDEIAESPSIWWSVKRQIESSKTSAVSPWPPATWLRRALAFGVPTVAAAAIVAALMISTTTRDQPDYVTNAGLPPPGVSPVTPADPEPEGPAEMPTRSRKAAERASLKRSSGRQATQAIEKSMSKPQQQEIKTEFIALSYARNPDSGQIVRVKVPSSMMVTLGLVQTVEKPANLVDAEVLVGDDGLTRAIRFVR